MESHEAAFGVQIVSSEIAGVTVHTVQPDAIDPVFKGKVFVIKVGGEVFADPALTRALVEQVGILHQVGIRTVNDDPLGITIVDANWVHENGPVATAERIKQVLGNHPVYLTFDIDCLDPAFAPGTGTPVCGGLSTAQAIEIMRGLVGVNLIGMDVVEVAPVYDVGQITALAGATLAAEYLCLLAYERPEA